MKVITLLGSDFSESCFLLSQKVSETYSPNLIIGILTGGGYVGREMMKSFNNDVAYTKMKLQRGSKKAKEATNIKMLLKSLPEFILNFLRVVEVEFLELKAKFVKPNRYGVIKFSDDVVQLLQKKRQKILLVDDCIDTGYPLKIIKEYIENYYPDNEIKIAVVTTAHRHPVIEADYQLYKRVLIRFPWAYDTK